MDLSSDLLRLLVGAPGLLVGALFLFLLLNRLFQDLISRRRRTWKERAERAIREWVAGRLEPAAMVDVLSNAPVAAAREALEEVWPVLLGEDRERLRRLARESGWARELRRRAGSPFWWRRMDVAQILAFVGTEEDLAAVVDLLEDRHMAVRVASTFTARDLSHPDLIDPLLRQAVVADPPRRRALDDAILSFGEAAVPKVRAELEDVPDDAVERQGVLLRLAGRLAELSDGSELFPAVLEHADSDHLEVRIQAVKALGSFTTERSIQPLRSALGDSAWQVRAQAAKGLGRLAEDEVRGDLRAALSDESWWVRLRAAIALRQLGEVGVRELESVDGEDDPYAHDMAVYVLRLEEAALLEHAA